MHKEHKETEYTVNDICCMCETLIEWVKADVAKGGDCLDVNVTGPAVDMIKDLCDAKEKLYKAEYYKTATDAMRENPMSFAPEYVQDQMQNDRAGYDHWRYSSGRFAPTGHGHRSGFTESPGMMAHHMDNMEHMERELQNGKAYRDYNMHRMHYTETHHPDDKRLMDENAKKHVLNMAETVAEVYRAADPEMKRDIKNDIQKLVNQMAAV